MERVLQSFEGKLTINLAIMAVMVVIGVYIVSIVRRRLNGANPPASQMMTSFRDLHLRGELSDEEYRNIKSKLANRMQNETEPHLPSAGQDAA